LIRGTRETVDSLRSGTGVRILAVLKVHDTRGADREFNGEKTGRLRGGQLPITEIFPDLGGRCFRKGEQDPLCGPHGKNQEKKKRGATKGNPRNEVLERRKWLVN